MKWKKEREKKKSVKETRLVSELWITTRHRENVLRRKKRKITKYKNKNYSEKKEYREDEDYRKRRRI